MLDLHPGVTALIGALFGTLVGVLLWNRILASRRRSLKALTDQAHDAAVEIRNAAETEAIKARDRQIADARAEAAALREEVRREVDQRRTDAERFEQRLTGREERIAAREQQVMADERAVVARRERIDERLERLTESEVFLKRQNEAAEHRLESLAGMTREEAADQVLRDARESAESAAAAHARKIIAEAERDAVREASRIIAIATQRLAARQTAETSVAVVPLPDDAMKGRIIGREGRNIRAFELLTGVDVIIDDTPDSVTVSCFDPIRREVARRSLVALVADGRIHPGRVEEIIERCRGELETELIELGERAAHELGVNGLDQELLRLIGRMRYRTSYGQNLYEHSQEVAWLAGMMAAELHLDVALARRGGLLHDIGKVLSHEHEGTHVTLGVDVARRHGEADLVLNAIEAHHNDVPHRSAESVLVQAADAISGSRPGARREALESYMKRMTRLEEIATEYEGVERSVVIQAGRELRVIVTPDSVSDDDARDLSEKIARKIESELQYPGQIVVTVIRETRASEVAR